MTIVANPHFDDFVAGSRLSRAKEGNGVPYSRTKDREPIYFFAPAAVMTLDSALRVVQRGLQSVGCDVDRNVALSLLGLLATICPAGTSPSQMFNDLLARVSEGTLHVNIVLPTRCDPRYAVTVGDCHIRPFDPDQLLYWAKKGRSYYAEDITALRGLTAISPEPLNVTLVNLDHIEQSVWTLSTQKLGMEAQCVADAYFNAVFEFHLAAMPSTVRRATQVLEAAGLIYVDMHSLINAFLSRRLGLFRWKSNQKSRGTWAVMNAQAELTINLPPPDRVVGCRSWLESQLGYTGINCDTALNRTLEMYCTLMQRGRQHQFSGARDEAALYFVIALDFLFGENGRATDSVAERAAVLTYLLNKTSYQAQHSRLRELYNARSRYVHLGNRMGGQEAADIERVATQVLWSFLSVSADGVYQTTEEWLKQIDYVGAAIQAGRGPSDTDVRAIGVRADVVPLERPAMP